MTTEGATLPRFVLVGYGRWGRVWAKLLNSMDLLACVVDIDLQHRRQAAYDYPHVGTFSELHPDVMEVLNGAVVATPPGEHLKPVLQLLAANVPTIVEKPMAPTEADARKMAEMAEARGVRLMVDHTFLASEAVMTAMNRVEEFCGTVRSARLTWTNMTTASHEGALWNLGPHPVSLTLMMAAVAGTEPRDFRVTACCTHRPGVLDNVDLSMSMQDGSRYDIHVSNYAAEKVRELTVYGEEGVVVCRPTQNEVVSRRHEWEPTKFLTDLKTGDMPLRNILRTFISRRPLGDEFGWEGVRCVGVMDRAARALVEEGVGI